jgi:hypothetical protein
MVCGERKRRTAVDELRVMNDEFLTQSSQRVTQRTQRTLIIALRTLRSNLCVLCVKISVSEFTELKNLQNVFGLKTIFS